jgi:hypothetical protein
MANIIIGIELLLWGIGVREDKAYCIDSKFRLIKSMNLAYDLQTLAS